jgi:hypothetical protein
MLTFQPRINQVSEQIVKRLRSDSCNEGTDNSRDKQHRIASLKRVKEI